MALPGALPVFSMNTLENKPMVTSAFGGQAEMFLALGVPGQLVEGQVAIPQAEFCRLHDQIEPLPAHSQRRSSSARFRAVMSSIAPIMRRSPAVGIADDIAPGRTHPCRIRQRSGSGIPSTPGQFAPVDDPS